MPNSSIKDEETYKSLREDGASKEKAARIANAQDNDSQHPGKKGANSRPTRIGPKTTSTTGRRNSGSRGVRIWTRTH